MRSARLFFTITEVIFNAIALLLGLRILLKFFGANTNTPFVNWTYETTQPLLAPFLGIFPNPRLTGGFLIEVSAIFALVVYMMLGYVVLSVVESLQSRTKKQK